MKSIGKILLTLGLTAGAVALILWGGRLYQAGKDPARAFEEGQRADRTAEYYAEDPLREAQEVFPEEQLGEPFQEPVETEKDQAAPLSGTGEDQEEPETMETPALQEEAEQQFGGKTVLLTLLGIDTDPAREERHMGWRSDAMVVCFIDVDRPACTLLTVPRDTRARVRRLDRKGNVKKTQWDKINAAYAYGGGKDKFSHENALYALSELLNVELVYYASIDMDAIGPVADAVGGVPLTLDVTIEGVGREGETVNLTGDAAYTYVRRRKGITGGSDLARTGRQQQFLKALAMKVKGMNAVAAVPKLFAALQSRVRTNLSVEQMAALAGVLNRLPEEEIRMVTLPGRARTIDGTSYYIMDEAKTEKLIGETMGEG